MTIILLIIYSVIDVLIFPNIERFPGLRWKLSYKGRDIYPVYRVFQFIIFGVSAAGLWHYTNWYYTAGYIAGFYLLTTDLFYYIFRWEWQALLHLDEKKADPYWLRHITQSGFWLFKPGFNFKLFIASSVLGVIINIIINLI